jgi:di/tricarboxylate transporter
MQTELRALEKQNPGQHSKTWLYWSGWVALGLVIMSLIIAAVLSEWTALTWQGWLAIAVSVAAFCGNAFTSLPAEVVFLGAAAVLFLSNVLDEEAVLSGFSNSGMITEGVLYIVAAGLQQTGALNWFSRQVLGLPKTWSQALVRMMLPVMGISAFLNNTPVVAMFIPVINGWCRKLRFSPSKLMLPLSYASIFGGLFTLIGTSTNLVVNGLLMDATQGPGLRLFDITGIGLPCGMVGFVFLYGTQSWLLPDRQPVLSDTDDLRQYTVDMVVVPDGPMVGKSIEKAGLRHLPGLYLAEIQRGPQSLPAVSPKEQLQGGDQLLFVGIIDSILDLQRLNGLQPSTDQGSKLDVPRTERSLLEAVVSSNCPLVGRTIREGQFRTRYNAVVVAVARNGERLTGKVGDIRLRAGDTLLLEAHPSFLNERQVSQDFYFVSDIPHTEPIRYERSLWALVLTLLMVVLTTVGWLTILQAAVLAAVGMLVCGCCSPRQAIGSIEWPVLLVIAAALALGEALDSTGAAKVLATGLVVSNPWVALAAIYTITTVLTEIITNNAAVALIFPIALSLAQQLDVSYMPFVIAMMIAASASFATPIGCQTNLMVYGPGGYKFSDFLRIGVPLNILYGVVTIAVAPLVYPF